MKSIKNVKIGIVSSMFWADIVNNLEKNCLESLKKNGIKKDQIFIVKVPGAMEIPLAVKKLAKKRTFDAIIVFGAIHKGKTYHFELIANECARGCMNVSLEYEVPVIFEVLATFDIQDAIDRATLKEGNKGIEAAEAAMKMIEVVREL